MLEITEKQHSPIGASSAERFWNCPGSVALIRDNNLVQDESKYAAEGTAAHELCDYYVKKGLIVDDFWLEEKIEVGEFTFTVNDEMMDAVKVFIDTIKEDLTAYNAPYAKVLSEQGFLLGHIDDEAFGTADAVTIIPYDRIIVYDFKYGKGVPVEVDGNKQLPYYGLGAYYELSPEDRAEIQEIEIVIVQPRADHPDGPVRRKRFSMVEIDNFEWKLTEAIRRVRDGDSTLSSGPHCKFCPAKPMCSAYREKLQNDAVVAFDAFAPKNELPAPNTLTLEQISTLMDNAKALNSWVASVISYAHQIAEQGQIIPGYKLVEGRANRRWKNEEDVIAQYKEECGESLYNFKLKSPAQMEKLLGKKRADELEALWEKPQGQKTLAPVGDRRDEQKPDVLTVFAEFV